MKAARQDERDRRAAENPVVGGLPDFPGIVAAMMISPSLASALRALADELLVRPFAGATISRADRELVATAVSARNDCFFCMDSHGAFATALLTECDSDEITELVNRVKCGVYSSLEPKMQALITIAVTVREDPLKLKASDVTAAISAGGTDVDVQLAIMISAAFCMYNRMVDGFRAKTPRDSDSYASRAKQVAEFGYTDLRLTSASPIG